MHQLYFIEAFLQAKVKSRVFMKFDSRYADYFTEYLSYFGRSLILLKCMHGRDNSGKSFSDELIEWFIESGFIQYQCQISIYYKYAPDGFVLFDLMLVIVSIFIHLKLL